MARRKDEDFAFSRRNFLRKMRWAPALFLPAPLYAPPFRSLFAEIPGHGNRVFDFADFRVTPHYPVKSPLDDFLRKVVPGTDEYVTEKYAFEIGRLLEGWSQGLRSEPPALSTLAKFLDASIEACSLVPVQQTALRSGNGIEVFRRRFASNVVPSRERFLQEIKTYLASMSRVETAEFEITGIEEIAGALPRVRVEIRYDIVGAAKDAGREQRLGHWLTQWARDEANGWRA